MAQSLQIPVEVVLDVNSTQMKDAQKQISGVIKTTKNFSSKDFFSPITNSAKKLNSSILGVNRSVDSLRGSFSSLAKIAISAISVSALVNVGKKMLELSSNLIEVQNVVDTVFGNMADDINTFSKNALTSFGLTEMQAKQYASTIGAIVKATGLSADATLQMSEGLTQLTGDVASFYNLDHDTAFEKLRSGITGETEPLKSLGVIMTETNLEAYRLAQGITTSYSAMNQAEKTALRYNFIMSTLKDSQGDFNKTQASWSNQSRILTGQIQQLGTIMGGLLQNILYPVLTAVNNILSLAISGAQALAKMFGFDMDGIQLNQGGSASGVGDVGSDAMEDLASSTDDATAAQDKLNKSQKKSLNNMYDLHTIDTSSDDSSSSSSSGSSGVSAGSGLSFDLSGYSVTASEQLNPFKTFAEDVMAMINADDWEGVGALFASKINSLFADKDFSDLSKKVNKWISNIARAFNGFLDELDAEGIGHSIGSFLNLIVSAIDTWLTTVDFALLGQRIAELINGGLATFDGVAFGKTIAHWFNACVDYVKGIVTTLKWSEIGQEIADAINGFFEEFDAKDVATTINTIVHGIETLIKTAIDGIEWNDIWNKIFEFWDNLDVDSKFVVALGGIALLAPKIVSLISGIVTIGSKLAPILTLFSKLGEVFALVAGGAGTLHEALVAIFGGIGTALAGILSVVTGAVMAVVNFFDMLANGFSWLKEILMVIGVALAAVGAIILGAPALVAGVIAGIVAAVMTLVVVIKDNWTAIVEFFKGVIESIKGFFSDLWTSIQTLFSTIGTWFSTKFTEAVNGIKLAFSVVVDFFSGILTGIQNVFTSIGTWFSTKFTEAVSNIKLAFSEVVSFFSGILTGIQNVFANIGTWFSGKFTDAVTGIKSAFSGLKEFFKGVWDGIVSVFSTIGVAISDAITGAVKGAINTLLGGAAGIINGFIKALNVAIGAINAIPGVSIDKLTEIEVPKLANGAVIPPNQEFLAILGDQKRGVNIETPLSTMLDAFKMALASSSLGSGMSGQIVIPVYVDGKLTSQEVIDMQDIERYRNNGK